MGKLGGCTLGEMRKTGKQKLFSRFTDDGSMTEDWPRRPGA
jgi:hypothetical protein